MFGLPEWSGCWRLVCMFRSLVCTAVIHRQQLMRRLKDAAFVIPFVTIQYRKGRQRGTAGTVLTIIWDYKNSLGVK